MNGQVIAFSMLEESNLVCKIHLIFKNETEVNDKRNLTQEKFYFYVFLRLCTFEF